TPQGPSQLLFPAESVLLAGEVGPLATPAAQRVDDAVDQLPDAVLAVGLANVASEVLLGDDVDRQLRPRGGDLDVLLLEDDRTLLVGDSRGSRLPVDQV